MKRPILMKGERLIDAVTKKIPGGEKSLPKTYNEAKNILCASLENIEREVYENRENFLKNEVIVSVKMEEGFLAKSYRPDFLTNGNNMTLVGARKSYPKTDESDESVEEYSENKIYFYRTSLKGLEELRSVLENDVLSETNKKALCRIKDMEFLKQEEKICGFLENDTTLDVEIVLHPLMIDYDEALKKIQEVVGCESEVRSYENGPTFILVNMPVEKLNKLSRFNFLRTIHPLREIELQQGVRQTAQNGPTCILEEGMEPQTIVGVFDGGISSNNTILNKFVKSHDLSSLPAKFEGIKHGTNVCSAVLFGEINQIKSSDFLPMPKVRVESFRVLPEKSWYTIIDNIENTVVSRPDIKVFNISFGPKGPIIDDQIDRFTYALDRLSALYDVLFCIAVGNDGDLPDGFNRIQSPSDSVNNLAVGAYSKTLNGEIYRADYSCVGLGREGGKLKPDVLEFGGDESMPFHALGVSDGLRDYTCGTSFSAPVVAGKVGRMFDISEDISPLVGRCLLVHNAQKNTGVFKNDGHGIVINRVEEMLDCSDKKVTIIYTGEILESKYIKLPIPLPQALKGQTGTVKITWTIATLSDVNANDSDGYTCSCIEDTLYTNCNKYTFSKDGKSKVLHLQENSSEIEDLINNKGYQRSSFPKSASAKYLTEEERRENLQWDTLVRKTVNKRPSSLDNPFLVLHCIPRELAGVKKVPFCVCVTVEHSKYNGDLYEEILKDYPVLVPLETNIKTEIDVTVEV